MFRFTEDSKWENYSITEEEKYDSIFYEGVGYVENKVYNDKTVHKGKAQTYEKPTLLGRILKFLCGD